MKIQAFRTMQGWTIFYNNIMVCFKSKDEAQRYILALEVIHE